MAGSTMQGYLVEAINKATDNDSENRSAKHDIFSATSFDAQGPVEDSVDDIYANPVSTLNKEDFSSLGEQQAIVNLLEAPDGVSKSTMHNGRPHPNDLYKPVQIFTSSQSNSVYPAERSRNTLKRPLDSGLIGAYKRLRLDSAAGSLRRKSISIAGQTPIHRDAAESPGPGSPPRTNEHRCEDTHVYLAATSDQVALIPVAESLRTHLAPNITLKRPRSTSLVEKDEHLLHDSTSGPSLKRTRVSLAGGDRTGAREPSLPSPSGANEGRHDYIPVNPVSPADEEAIIPATEPPRLHVVLPVSQKRPRNASPVDGRGVTTHDSTSDPTHKKLRISPTPAHGKGTATKQDLEPISRDGFAAVAAMGDYDLPNPYDPPPDVNRCQGFRPNFRPYANLSVSKQKLRSSSDLSSLERPSGTSLLEFQRIERDDIIYHYRQALDYARAVCDTARAEEQYLGTRVRELELELRMLKDTRDEARGRVRNANRQLESVMAEFHEQGITPSPCTSDVGDVNDYDYDHSRPPSRNSSLPNVPQTADVQ